MDIKERIRSIIDDRDMTQKELAALLDIPPTTLNGYLTGRSHIPLDVLKQITVELNITADYLLGNTKNPARPFTLSPSEQQFVTILRTLSKEQRELIFQSLRLMQEQNQR